MSRCQALVYPFYLTKALSKERRLVYLSTLYFAIEEWKRATEIDAAAFFEVPGYS